MTPTMNRLRLAWFLASLGVCAVFLSLGVILGRCTPYEEDKLGYGGTSILGCENTGTRSKACEYQVDPVTIDAGVTAVIWTMPIPAPVINEHLQVWANLNFGALSNCDGALCNGHQTRLLDCTWTGSSCLDSTNDASDLLTGQLLPTVLADATATIVGSSTSATIVINGICPAGGPQCSIGGTASVNRILPAVLVDSGASVDSGGGDAADASDAADAASDAADAADAADASDSGHDSGSDAGDSGTDSGGDSGSDSGSGPVLSSACPLVALVGNTVTLHGSGFSAGSFSASFGGTSGTSPTVISDSEATVAVPSGLNTTGAPINLTVTTTAGTSGALVFSNGPIATPDSGTGYTEAWTACSDLEQTDSGAGTVTGWTDTSQRYTATLEGTGTPTTSTSAFSTSVPSIHFPGTVGLLYGGGNLPGQGHNIYPISMGVCFNGAIVTSGTPAVLMTGATSSSSNYIDLASSKFNTYVVATASITYATGTHFLLGTVNTNSYAIVDGTQSTAAAASGAGITGGATFMADQTAGFYATGDIAFAWITDDDETASGNTTAAAWRAICQRYGGSP